MLVTGVVGVIGDGRFKYSGGLFGGTWASMGTSAVLHIGSIEVLIVSQPTYEWADEQYCALKMDVRKAKFVGVKNPMNYRFTYRATAAAAFIVDTPGPTPAHMLGLPYRHIDRPCFPFESEIPDLTIPCVLNQSSPLNSAGSGM